MVRRNRESDEVTAIVPLRKGFLTTWHLARAGAGQPQIRDVIHTRHLPKHLEQLGYVDRSAERPALLVRTSHERIEKLIQRVKHLAAQVRWRHATPWQGEQIS